MTIRCLKAETLMDTLPAPFVPPAPIPRKTPPSTLEMIRIVYRNPLELWGEPSYNEPWISVNGIGGPLVIANDPGADPPCAGRQCQELQDGDGAPEDPAADPARRAADGRGRRLEALAQGDGAGLHAAPHLRLRRADAASAARPLPSATRTGGTVDVAADMTMLTYDILAETLFSGEIAGEPGSFASADRPPVRDHGPRRSARPAARARLAAAPDPAARPQDAWPISARSSPTPSPCAASA